MQKLTEIINIIHSIRTLKLELINLTPNGRINVFDQLIEDYCIHCGYDLDNTGICHCTNDE